MKNLFKIDISFWLYALLYIISGYINYFISMMFIIFIHGLGHIIVLKLFRIKINYIRLLPMGGIINSDILINASFIISFFVSIGGVLAQILLGFIISDFYGFNINIMKEFNVMLLLYNCLPIEQLDGEKVLNNIFNVFLNFRVSKYISYFLSLITLLIFFYFTHNYIVFIVLFCVLCKSFKERVYLFNKFLLERYLYNFNFKRKVLVKRISLMFKYRYNYIKCDKILCEEKEILNNYFIRNH